MTPSDVPQVSICAIDFALPRLFATQTELESLTGRQAGHYVIGLGQKELSFCSRDEDPVTLALEATERVISRYATAVNSTPSDIASRLTFVGVGSESQLDRAKSIKSHVTGWLSTEYGTGGYTEGCDFVNACYGATAAVLAANDHLLGRNIYGMDGLALVVATDVAEYQDPKAVPTQGAGSVAMLMHVGTGLSLRRSETVTWSCDSWDFYKPQLERYPRLDGHGDDSLIAYMRAVQHCVLRSTTSISGASAFIAHSPYRKMTLKALTVALAADRVRSGSTDEDDLLLAGDSLTKEAVSRLQKKVGCYYQRLCGSDGLISERVGNTYTASVWMGVLSFVSSPAAQCADRILRDIAVFSYGSGSIASLLWFDLTSHVISPSLDEILERLAGRREESGTVLLTHQNMVVTDTKFIITHNASDMTRIYTRRVSGGNSPVPPRATVSSH